MTPTIPSVFAELARLSPDAPAVTCEGQSITRRELDESSTRLARAYAALGVTGGSYVTIMLPNSVEWYQAALAVWKLGAIPQPLAGRMPPAELKEILALVPRALIVGRTDLSPTIPHVPAGFIPTGHSADPLPEAVSPAWKAMASGGSTGRPKLIEVTSDSRVDLVAAGRAFAMQPHETQLVTGPLAHNNSMMMSIMGLLLGQHLVVMPRFDAARMLELITAHRVNFISTVPTVLKRALAEYRRAPDAHDLSSIRHIWHGAAPCPPDTKHDWIDLLGADAIWEYYGGTEMQAGTFISGPDWLTHPGSVGTVTIGRIEARRTDGSVCDPGETGDLYMQASGPSPYRYIGAQPETRDDWETIGDLGWFDQDGFLYLADRRVDMFNVGGAKVYPAEIESALASHPDVLSCLVVGVPDDDLGQVPYALVNTQPDTSMTLEGVRAFLADRLITYKLPRFLEQVDQPLRDDAGKARRGAVRAAVIGRMTILQQPAGS